MKRSILFFLFIFGCYALQAQPKIKNKKYPSLLWEISGNGFKKPSYLIGTMHVSNKLAFHLPDSFYFAIRNVQVVALETNPETWQEDMSDYNMARGRDNLYGEYRSVPNDYLSINTLKFFKYDNRIGQALYSTPAAINNLLYRSYGNESSDFEEDTYLDMYIFQCGKKWSKKVTGLEDYAESMQLMAEAYKDAAKDKNRKDRSYDLADDYSIDKLQEAYRTGNLDLLDSINNYNSTSSAFDEKFLFKRNEIQARSMDSIIKSGQSLFAGVGAAHLPGKRGVIELLRKKGYKLRPIKMGERDSRDKEIVDKMRVPVSFRTEIPEDSLFKVDIPGKFYRVIGNGELFPSSQFSNEASLEQKQYADMSNGSYYMVTRLMTNAWMWSHTPDDVYKKVDSLLYENVPGKMISRSTIFKNGFKGFDITSRTRRGDLQRYQVFITPFEIIFFKMGGNGDYVKAGEEANKFFGSIQFREYKSPGDPSSVGWKKFTPSYGGFAVDLPHDPFIGNDGSWIYDATDKSTGTQYRIMRTDIHNFDFIGEDTFDLELMNESFMASEFIDSVFERRPGFHKGFPALDGKYHDKSGGVFLTRFIIQGPHYYTLIAHGKQEIPVMKNFLNSFEIKPFVYRAPKLFRDTSLYFSVMTPVYPEEKKIMPDIPRFNYFGNNDEEDEPENRRLEAGVYRSKIISNDSTGEKIYISFFRSPVYFYVKDSAKFNKEKESVFFDDTTMLYNRNTISVLPGNIKVREAIMTDTSSSRTLLVKTFYRDGTRYTLATASDTLMQPSPFIKKFYESFIPADTLKGINPFVKKSNLFFDDLLSKDSLLRKRAINYIDKIVLDSSDLPKLKQAIAGLSWKEKKYLDIKESLVAKLGAIKTKEAALYLKDLYYSMDDTVQLQYSVLESLLQHKTQYAFGIFRDIINTEPPVLDAEAGDIVNAANALQTYIAVTDTPSVFSNYSNGNFLDELSASLPLTKTILPDLLMLLNLEDYKRSIMKLLGQMVDSNLVQPRDYEMYFSKFLIEAKQEFKKQSIAEKKKAIRKAQESRDENKLISYYGDDDENGEGNEDLSLYARLLLPFAETHTTVQPLLQQMLRSGDKELKYNTMLLLLRHQKPFPDSLLRFFAGLDVFRYRLYTDLRLMKKADRFPVSNNNKVELGRSALLSKNLYGKPDSILYLDRLPAKAGSKKGFIYFYAYKSKKDDPYWKLASAGLVPEDPDQFEFAWERPCCQNDFSPMSMNRNSDYDFTGFSEIMIVEDEPVLKQLNKAVKKLLYSRRKSGLKFYDDEGARSVIPGYMD